MREDLLHISEGLVEGGEGGREHVSWSSGESGGGGWGRERREESGVGWVGRGEEERGNEAFAFSVLLLFLPCDRREATEEGMNKGKGGGQVE